MTTNNEQTFLIVGGVAGGMSAATRLRRLNERARIVVVERSGYVSFANCGLPYHLGGVIKDRNALLLQTPKSLGARFRLDVRVNTEVTSINTEAHTAILSDLRSGETTELRYSTLILSPGARPFVPPIPGAQRALVLRDVEDTDALITAASGKSTAAVIGGGFIGVELAENLVQLGLKTSIIEATEQVMAPLDPEMAAIVHEEIRAKNVDLHLGATVSEIADREVILADGSTVPAELVIMAIGVRPETTLAHDAGIVLGKRGGIQIDEHFATSAPDVYAIGDAVEKVDALTHDATLVPLANTANRQGRVLADYLSGLPGQERPVLGTSIVRVFNLVVAATGWNEKRLQAAGKAYTAIHTHPSSHAGYYPGATGMHLKLLFEPSTGEILGAQAVGADGVDKRIDVIATAIAGGMKAWELQDLELAYAPPFGSAKDPINMLGYIAQNHKNGLTQSVQWHELDDARAAGATLIDVRTAAEHQRGAIPGSLNIPLDELRERLAELPEGDLIVSCAVGLRGYLAVRLLKQYGKSVKNLDGGYSTWRYATV